MRKKIFLVFFTVIFYLVLVFIPDTGKAFFSEGSAGPIPIPNPLTCDSFEECINKIVDFIFYLAVVLVPLMIIIAGFLFVTAAGNTEKIAQAKKIITWALIGFLIVLISKGIVALITNILGG